jgi:lipopolysaccharide biosynthesis protein
MPTVAVLCHLYYEDSLEGLLPYLKNLVHYNTRFFFNLCSDTTYYQEVRKELLHHFENVVITCSPNVGKDIGGKLVLLDACLKLWYDCDYLVWLHDKKSPHTTTGTAWREKLLAILEQRNIEAALAAFEKQPNIGLIGSKAMLLNEYDAKTGQYACTSNRELQLLRKDYGIRANNHSFIGGTMFWCRASVYKNFFSRHSPLAIRATLEKGNVLDHHQGSLSHAWERMLSWIALNEGLQIKGI